MNYEQQRQRDAHKARLERFGVSSVVPLPVVRRPLPRSVEPPKKVEVAPPPVVVQSAKPVPAPKITDIDLWEYHGLKAPHPKVRVSHILQTTAAEFDLDVEDILSDHRKGSMVFARFVAIHRIHRAFPRWSYPRIGNAVGRNHTTIMYALGKLERKPRILAKVLEAV